MPVHAQAQGPVPLKVVAVPAVQRPVVGAVETATPFAGPQTPLMAVGCSGALHESFVPPRLPLHVQFQGPVPVTVVAVPAVQRLVVGAVVTATPFAGPQDPLTAFRGSACADSTKNKRQKAAREIPLIIVRFPFGRWLPNTMR